MGFSAYITHPEVAIDPATEPPGWHLSDKGRRRAEALAARSLFANGTLFVASDEPKAFELAGILAASCGGRTVVRSEFRENNRSATGYLPPDEFEAQVDLLFGRPEESANGWETARHAQHRIVAAVHRALDEFESPVPVVFCGHGCVGTLLKCHVAGRPIARRQDQREVADPGGGNCFTFDLAGGRLLCDWTPIEEWSGFGA